MKEAYEISHHRRRWLYWQHHLFGAGRCRAYPIILDSLITGREEFTHGRIFYRGDIADEGTVRQVFRDHPDIQATVHCAALIVVPESVSHPYEYYKDNVSKSIEFFHTLADLGYGQVVFSSSAALYDVVPGFMVTEEAPLNPNSPYARTKLMMEMVLKDFCAAYNMRGIALRYFNPIGADPKMRSGIHVKHPTHVLGKLVDTAQGRLPEFEITGTNYSTRDGTGIRDYIHVWDLARAHVNAVTDFAKVFERAGNPRENYLVINLGTGRGVTVGNWSRHLKRFTGKRFASAKPNPALATLPAHTPMPIKPTVFSTGKRSYPSNKGLRMPLKWDEVRKQMLHYES